MAFDIALTMNNFNSEKEHQVTRFLQERVYSFYTDKKTALLVNHIRALMHRVTSAHGVQTSYYVKHANDLTAPLVPYVVEVLHAAPITIQVRSGIASCDTVPTDAVDGLLREYRTFCETHNPTTKNTSTQTIFPLGMSSTEDQAQVVEFGKLADEVMKSLYALQDTLKGEYLERDRIAEFILCPIENPHAITITLTLRSTPWPHLNVPAKAHRAYQTA